MVDFSQPVELSFIIKTIVVISVFIGIGIFLVKKKEYNK